MDLLDRKSLQLLHVETFFAVSGYTMRRGCILTNKWIYWITNHSSPSMLLLHVETFFAA
jgi:hypothetical protein